MTSDGFADGDLVEIVTRDALALARVRESGGGRLHVALELGVYLPWVDEEVMVRQVTNEPSTARVCTARMLHVGATTALLQIVAMAELPRPSVAPRAGEPARGRLDTIPTFDDDDW